MDGLTVAVTGAGGFLGTAVTRRLHQGGAQVRSLARSPAELAEPFFLGDLKTGGWPDEAFHGADAVIHCAAALGGPLAHQRLVNRDGTAMVAAQAAAAGVSRFVHISSIAVYGYHGDSFPETRRLQPSSQAYATTKAEAEVELAGEFPGATIIRPGGMFGPGANFWSLGFAKRGRRRLPLNIGKGSGTLPVIYVEDVADLAVVAATNGAAAGEAFNCVLDPPPTWRQYQAAYGAVVGRDRWLPLPTILARGAAKVVSWVGKSGSNASVMDELLGYALRKKRFPMDKAQSMLGWEPRFDLETAVAATAPWVHQQLSN